MEIGLTFSQELFAQKVVETAFKNGLNLVYDDGGNIQIMPPLTIDRETLEEGTRMLVECVLSLSS